MKFDILILKTSILSISAVLINISSQTNPKHKSNQYQSDFQIHLILQGVSFISIIIKIILFSILVGI